METKTVRAKIFKHFLGLKVPMSGYNPHYDSKFSTYEDVVSTIKPICEKVGLVFTQELCSEEDRVGVITHIQDTDNGDFISSAVYFPVVGGKANAVQEGAKNGSFLKRVALIVAFGLIGEDDTGAFGDGHDPAPKANKEPEPRFTRANLAAQVGERLVPDEQEQLFKRLDLGSHTLKYGTGAVKAVLSKMESGAFFPEALADVASKVGK